MSESQPTLEQIRSRYAEAPEQREAVRQPQRKEINVGDAERWVSIGSGSLLALLGLGRRGLPGLAIAAVGGDLIYRGVTGYSPLYQALGIDTARKRVEDRVQRGIRVVQSYTINKPAQELYQFWRNFENLPRIMTYLESVQVLDEKRSHWVAKAPGFMGGKVEWDAEITRDESNSLIAWRSLPNADIDNTGWVRFVDRGDRGTMVTVCLQYVAPAGRLGQWVAKLTGKEPEQQIREDLRNFKRIMEAGEVITIAGQPRGTCTGKGASPEEQ